jgi:hypothetical protein
LSSNAAARQASGSTTCGGRSPYFPAFPPRSRSPSLWVALRPTGSEPPYILHAVTADSAEGEALTEMAGDIVETVPMPDDVADVVAQFVTEHHIERVFFKRKRKEADPESLARRSPLEKDRR